MKKTNKVKIKQIKQKGEEKLQGFKLDTNISEKEGEEEIREEKRREGKRKQEEKKWQIE